MGEKRRGKFSPCKPAKKKKKKKGTLLRTSAGFVGSQGSEPSTLREKKRGERRGSRQRDLSRGGRGWLVNEKRLASTKCALHSPPEGGEKREKESTSSRKRRRGALTVF